MPDGGHLMPVLQPLGRHRQVAAVVAGGQRPTASQRAGGQGPARGGVGCHLSAVGGPAQGQGHPRDRQPRATGQLWRRQPTWGNGRRTAQRRPGRDLAEERQKESRYGYRSYVTVDQEHGYVRGVHDAPANGSGIEAGHFEAALKAADIEAARVLADKGYAGATSNNATKSPAPCTRRHAAGRQRIGRNGRTNWSAKSVLIIKILQPCPIKGVNRMLINYLRG
jgi:hypothetical protein